MPAEPASEYVAAPELRASRGASKPAGFRRAASRRQKVSLFERSPWEAEEGFRRLAYTSLCVSGALENVAWLPFLDERGYSCKVPRVCSLAEPQGAKETPAVGGGEDSHERAGERPILEMADVIGQQDQIALCSTIGRRPHSRRDEVKSDVRQHESHIPMQQLERHVPSDPYAAAGSSNRRLAKDAHGVNHRQACQCRHEIGIEPT